MSLFNQFSALPAFLLPLGILIVSLRLTQYPTIRRYGIMVGVLGTAVLALFIFGSRVEGDSAAEVESVLDGNGRPVLVELYSNY